MLLIIGGLHFKNQRGLEEMLRGEYTYGTMEDISGYTHIYSPSAPINTTLFPDKFFLFGPHFSLFPDTKLLSIRNVHNNSVYLLQSQWILDIWTTKNAAAFLPLSIFPFPVDTTTFCPTGQPRQKVFVYMKHRDPLELAEIEDYLDKKNITYTLFDYGKGYKEEDYIAALKESKYGIVLAAYEIQGFAIEEALSADVPLFVWDCRTMLQDYSTVQKDYACTSVPYWDDRCGIKVYTKGQFELEFPIFLSRLSSYEPRQFILENLSVGKCRERWNALWNTMHKEINEVTEIV
jgi:hypothetical protein